MPRNVLQARSTDVGRLSQEFQTLMEHYGRNSFTKEEQRQFMEAFEQALYNITLSFRGRGCPPGYVECPGGGCAQNQRVCIEARRIAAQRREEADRR